MAAVNVIRDGGGVADCGNSGTTMRLLTGALAALPGTFELTGDESLSRRPMERVADPLRAMGADVQTTKGFSPITITGHRPLRALGHRLPMASAQVLGAICFAALGAQGTTRVHVPVRPATTPSACWLRSASISLGSAASLPSPGLLVSDAVDLTVPGDFSSAAVWLVAATVHPDAAVTLQNVGLNPTRTAMIDVLREMGAGDRRDRSPAPRAANR